jgi:hypothetical protein
VLLSEARPALAPSHGRAFDSGEVVTVKQPPKKPPKSRSRRRPDVGDAFWQMVLAAFVAGLVVGFVFMPALHAHLRLARSLLP